MNRIYLYDDDPRFNNEVRLIGVGFREPMPPELIERRQGLPYWLLVMFHDAVEIEFKGVRQEVAPETAVLWDMNCRHVFGNRKAEWSHSWIVFGGSLFSDDIESLRSHLEKPMNLRCQAHCLEAMRGLLREFMVFDRPEHGIIACLIQLILREVSREVAERDWQPEREPEQRAADFIRRHFRESPSVDCIATEAGLSASRLQQRFHARYGVSLQQSVERHRLEEARYWLLHGGLRVAEVATRTGFDDPFYFSRRFRRYFGVSPSQYRAEYPETRHCRDPKQPFEPAALIT